MGVALKQLDVMNTNLSGESLSIVVYFVTVNTMVCDVNTMVCDVNTMVCDVNTMVCDARMKHHDASNYDKMFHEDFFETNHTGLQRFFL